MSEIAFKCPHCGGNSLKTTPDPEDDTPVICDDCGEKIPTGSSRKDVVDQAKKVLTDSFRDIFKK